MRRMRERWIAAGFLTFAVGFLTAAVAGPLEDSVARLDRLEAERAAILQEADSLGSILGRLSGGDRPRVLESAERLAGRVRELDLEILLERQRCRSLASQELEALRESTTPESSRRESDLLILLEKRLGEDWKDDLIFVEPDSADGYETLLDKHAYLIDLQERIVGLQKNLDRRIDRARREQGLRRASAGFAEESRFLDEGGRVGSDEVVLLRGISGGGDPIEGQGRLSTTGSGLESAGETDAAAGMPADSDLGVLARARGNLGRDLGRVAALLGETEALLRLYPGGAP